MKTILLFALFLLSNNSATSNQVIADDNKLVTKVYICNSKTSKKYHYNKNCRGLNACKSEIKELYLKEAKHKGRTLCGWED